MSAVDITPTTTIPTSGGNRYRPSPKGTHSYSVSAVDLAPPELRLTLRLRREDDAIWARIDELDVSAEGTDVFDALRGIIGAVRDLLGYLRDETSPLAPDLEAQARFVPLLDARPSSWFRTTAFVD